MIRLLFLLALLLGAPAQAQQSSGFIFNAATSISPTVASSNVALPGSGSKVIIQNTGVVTAYLAFGNASVTATPAGMPIAAGACYYVQVTNFTTIAAISPLAVAPITAPVITLTQGEGNPPLFCGGPVPVSVSGTNQTLDRVVGPTVLTAVGAASPSACAATGCLAVNSQGTSTVGVTVTANTNVTLVAEVSDPAGTNWATTNLIPQACGTNVTSIPSSTNGLWYASSGGFAQVRIRATATGATPTATISLDAGAGDNNACITAAIQAATIANAPPGTPNTTTVLSVQGEAGMTPVQGALNVAPSIANGNGTVAAATANAADGVTPIVGGSAVSSLVLKASAGNLYNVYAECSAACWLMVFNSVSAPSNGATTAGTASGNMVECVAIAAGANGAISYGQGPPEVFSVGITAAISSTTCATLTLATTGFLHGMIK